MRWLYRLGSQNIFSTDRQTTTRPKPPCPCLIFHPSPMTCHRACSHAVSIDGSKELLLSEQHIATRSVAPLLVLMPILKGYRSVCFVHRPNP
jgi:hypothetical protein